MRSVRSMIAAFVVIMAAVICIGPLMSNAHAAPIKVKHTVTLSEKSGQKPMTETSWLKPMAVIVTMKPSVTSGAEVTGVTMAEGSGAPLAGDLEWQTRPMSGSDCDTGPLAESGTGAKLPESMIGDQLLAGVDDPSWVIQQDTETDAGPMARSTGDNEGGPQLAGSDSAGYADGAGTEIAPLAMLVCFDKNTKPLSDYSII